MNIGLWLIQGAFRPLDAIATMMTWVSAVPPPLVRFIGVAELQAGQGLNSPAATGILPRLSICAAVGLALVMALAAILHFVRREYGGAMTVSVIFVLAALVAYGRWQIAPL